MVTTEEYINKLNSMCSSSENIFELESNMLTLVLPIKNITSNNKHLIRFYMKQYTAVHRCLYTNWNNYMSMSVEDRENKLKYLQTRHKLTEYLMRTCVDDVKTTVKREKESMKDIRQKIWKTEKALSAKKKEFEEINGVKKIDFNLCKELYFKDKNVSNQIKKRFKEIRKLEIRLSNLKNTLRKFKEHKCVYGGAVNFRTLTQTCNKLFDEKYIDEYEELTERKERLQKTIKENRLRPFHIKGEANQNGNRHVDLSQIDKGKLTVKFKKGEHVNVDFIYKDKQELLSMIQEMSMNKSLPVYLCMDDKSIRLTVDLKLLMSYQYKSEKQKEKEAEVLNNKKLKLKEKKELIKQIYSTTDKISKVKYVKRYSDVIMAMDNNPGYIGYSICKLNAASPGGFDVLYAGEISWFELMKKLGVKSDNPIQIIQNDKRVYEIIYSIGNILFEKFDEYGCSAFICENLNIKQDDLNNKVANRKCKNLWHREVIEQKCKKSCALRQVRHIEVNPAYSSFIGNIKYKYTDAVSASLEILRRGILYMANPNEEFKNDDICPRFTLADKDTLKSIFGDSVDELVVDVQTWAACFKVLKEKFKNQQFQTRVRSGNVDCVSIINSPYNMEKAKVISTTLALNSN